MTCSSALTQNAAPAESKIKAIIEMLDPGKKPNCMDSKYNPSRMPALTEYNLDCMLHFMKNEQYKRAVAIAEGCCDE